MLAHPTLDQLNALGLYGLAKGFKELEHKAEARSLDHAEWLGLLLEYELTLRRQKQFETRARVARLRHPASVEDVDYQSPSRARPRALPQARRLRLDRRAPQSARNRGQRPGQKLARLRARPQGVPRKHLCSLCPRSQAVRRSRHRARRGALRQAPALPGARQTAHPRRLGTRSAHARPGARSPRNRRGPLRQGLAHHHQSGSRGPLARSDRGPHSRRRSPGSRRPQRLSHRTGRRELAQAARLAVKQTSAAKTCSPNPRRDKAVDNGGLRYGAMESALRPSLPTATRSGPHEPNLLLILRRPKSMPA